MRPQKNLNYLGALMQQAGVTTLGDLFFGGVNLDLEASCRRASTARRTASARIVHVADGFTAKQLYGDEAVTKALAMQAQIDRPDDVQGRQVLRRRRLRQPRHGDAVAGLRRCREVQGPVHVLLEGGFHSPPCGRGGTPGFPSTCTPTAAAATRSRSMRSPPCRPRSRASTIASPSSISASRPSRRAGA